MRKKAVMDFTFLDKCFLAIPPQTWKEVNELLGRYGVRQGAVNPKVIRTDTTVVESNVHHPTDSSLLWDTWRVATRLLERAREILRKSVPHRFHSRKIKGLYLFITRHMPSKSASRQQQVKANFRTLIERVEWILAIAGDFSKAYASSSNLELDADGGGHRPAGERGGRDGSCQRAGVQPVRAAHGVDPAWAAAEAGGVRP
jgi:hypothetical protein